MAKLPQRTNLGGMWLLNPHAPRCTQTNLEGVKQKLVANFDPDGQAHTGTANAVPTGWLLTVPDGTGVSPSSLPHFSKWNLTKFLGQHILRQQPYPATPEDGSTAAAGWKGGAGHPFHFLSNPGKIASCVWWDSMKYRIRYIWSNAGLPPGPTDGIQSYRGHYWSLYYGDHPNYLGIDAQPVTEQLAWWLVAGLEPMIDVDVEDISFDYFALFMFSHPETDPGIQSTQPTFAGSRDQQVRFNPLGANVFKRFRGYSETLGDELTIRPFYS